MSPRTRRTLKRAEAQKMGWDGMDGGDKVVLMQARDEGGAGASSGLLALPIRGV